MLLEADGPGPYFVVSCAERPADAAMSFPRPPAGCEQSRLSSIDDQLK